MCKTAQLQGNLLPIDVSLALMLPETPVLEAMDKERKNKDRESLARSERGRTGRLCRFLQPRRQTQEQQHRLFFVTPPFTTEPCDCRFCIRELNGFHFLSGVVCTENIL